MHKICCSSLVRIAGFEPADAAAMEITNAELSMLDYDDKLIFDGDV